MEKELRIIKEVILETAKRHGIYVEKIILFGSRARGEGREDSDWDILIVTREKLDWRVECEFWADVEDSLVRAGIIPEIIIADSERFRRSKHLTGFVYFWAEREGVAIK